MILSEDPREIGGLQLDIMPYMKKIAVITPVFNGEKFIADCIQSVLLSHTNEKFSVEHTVIDDGSTDNTWEALHKISAPNLKKLRMDHNIGSSASRNFAIKHTDADYIFCLDADDIIFQNSLGVLFETMHKYKADWVYGDFLRADENLRYLVGDDYYGHHFKNSSDILSSIFSGEHFFQQNCMYSKKFFDAAGSFDESMKVCEDLDLFIRFALKGYCPVYVPGPLYLHRFHQDNVSKATGRENNLEVHREDVKKLHDKYK